MVLEGFSNLNDCVISVLWFPFGRKRTTIVLAFFSKDELSQWKGPSCTASCERGMVTCGLSGRIL